LHEEDFSRSGAMGAAEDSNKGIRGAVAPPREKSSSRKDGM